MSRIYPPKPPSTRLRPPSKRQKALEQSLRRQTEPKTLKTHYFEARRLFCRIHKKMEIVSRRTGSNELSHWLLELEPAASEFEKTKGGWEKYKSIKWDEEKVISKKAVVQFKRMLWSLKDELNCLMCEEEEIQDLGNELSEWSVS